LDSLKLSNWLTLIANVGVIAGIVFLGIEINQNSKLLRAESSFSMLQNRQIGRNQVFEDPEIAQLMIKGENGEPLSDIEQYRLTNRIESIIIGWEWEYRQYLEGNIEEIPFTAWRNLLKSPLYTHVGWRSVEGKLSPEFIRFLNENIVED